VVHKDFEAKLLVLLIVFLVLLTSSTIYYETALRNIKSEYSVYKNEHPLITARAVAVPNSSSEPSSLNNLQYLESGYRELHELNEKLKERVRALEDDLLTAKSKAEYQKAKDIGPTESFRLVQSKNMEIRQIKEKIQEICGILNSNNISYYECK